MTRSQTQRRETQGNAIENYDVLDNPFTSGTAQASD